MKDELEKFIRNNQDYFDGKFPGPTVLDRVLEQMQPKEKPKQTGILIPFPTVRRAAVVFTLITCGVALWTLQKRPEPIAKVKIKAFGQQQFTKRQPCSSQKVEPTEATETAKRESADLVDEDLNIRKQALLAKLRAKSLNAKKQVIFAGLNNMASPASRITSASIASKFNNTSNDIVDALVETLNTDPNANVKLAALDGLNRFYRRNYVRKKLIASLKKQEDPVVQIALINLLTRIKKSGILEELEKMVNDENTQKVVKDCAYSSIIQLSSS